VLPVHSAEGPVTIHVLEGSVTFSVLEHDYELTPGDVLILAAGVRHSAISSEGVRFLLTLVRQPPASTHQTEAPT
jgi:quercetin dioxygenase-like cupin family protein